MKILIDIDNVISDFVTAMVAYLNVKYNKKFKSSDVTVWDFVDSPNLDITKSQFYQSLNEFVELKLWNKSPIYFDANMVLNRLFKDHCVIYLSSRPAIAANETISFFEKNGLPFNGLQILENEAQPVLCGNIALCQGFRKGEIAKNWEADIAIEDRPSTIQNYIDKGIMVVRKEEPYNSNVKYIGDLSLLKSSPNLIGFEKIINQIGIGEI